MNLLKNLRGKLIFNEPLSKHTSFRIGGRASIFFQPKDLDDLISCLSYLKKNKLSYFIIGSGTNLLPKDNGFKGAVIKLSSPYFKNISIRKNVIKVGAGMSIDRLMKFLSDTDLSGYEFLAGIPGSVGGALVMNAGTIFNKERQSISDILNKAKVLDKNGRILNIPRKDLKLNYRSSNLGKYIVLEAQLKLKNKTNKELARNRIKNFLDYRKQKQDYSKPSAGCIFKNPKEDLSAGELIDRCGLKGKQIGGAMISCKHANFILNFNRAKSNDVIKLIKTIKREVKNKFGIKLEEEIRIVS